MIPFRLLPLCSLLIFLSLFNPASLAATIELLPGDPSLTFTPNWQDRLLNNATFRFVSDSGPQLTIALPRNTTQFSYTGLKLVIASTYGVCIDDVCDRTNRIPTIDARDPNASATPVVLFVSSNLNPELLHTVTIFNQLSSGSGAITFVSVIVTTNVDNAATSTTLISSSTTKSSPASFSSPTGGTVPSQASAISQSENHSLSSTIIVLSVLGSVSLLVGLIIFLHSARRQRLKLMQQLEDGDEGGDLDDNQLFAKASAAPHQEGLPTVARLSGIGISPKPTLKSTTTTMQSSARSLLASSLRYKSLPVLPPPSRPVSVAPPLPVANPRDSIPGEPRRLPSPAMFRPSFLDFDVKPDAGQSHPIPPSRFSFSTTGH